MPIWKQRLLSSLMSPSDGEGNDLGGQESESAAPTGTPGPGTDDAVSNEEGVSAIAEEPASSTDLPTDKPVSDKIRSMLDELSVDAKQPTQDEIAKELKQDNPDIGDGVETKTPEQEESELLDGVKSERGKERIRQVFAERKQLEHDMTEFRQMVQGTGMSAQDFAQTLEFGRLVNSGNEKDIRVALEMIEGQRSALYQKLGVEAPGVDLLAGQDDLKEAVERMEIPRDRAVELARFRKSEAAKVQQQQELQASSQRLQDVEKDVKQASGAMEAYLTTRANEVDHPARMKAITSHFQNPDNLQAFIQTYKPSQWVPTIRMMYDGIVVPKVPVQHVQQPMRSRPTTQGVPVAVGSTPIERLASKLDSMGI